MNKMYFFKLFRVCIANFANSGSTTEPATAKRNIAMQHRHELNVHIYVKRYDKKRFTSSIDPLPTPQKHFTVLAY